MHDKNTFGVKTSHGQTRTYKTHHGLDLGEATTFPLIVYFVLGHKTSTQMSFVLGLPSVSPEIPTIGTPATFGAHNFTWRTSIKVRSKAKL
jgi:hypothetical protein